MRDVCRLDLLALIGLFRSRASLQAESFDASSSTQTCCDVNRRSELTFTSIDRLVFAGLLSVGTWRGWTL